MRATILSRLTAVAAAVLVAVLSFGTPAQAGIFGFHHEWGGNTTDQSIAVDITVNFLATGSAENYYQADFRVGFSPNYTSAKRCRLTSYVTLSVGSGTSWNSTKKITNCDDVVTTHEGDYRSYNLITTYTSGTKSILNVCMDLYYGSSTSSGWQRCAIPKPTVYAS